MNTIKLSGKIYANIWICTIIGSIMILIESILNIENILEAGISIGISVIVIICSLLSRKDVYATGIIIVACSYFLLLSPIGYSGYGIAPILILLGGLFTVSGGLLFFAGNFFIYVAIGAVVTDLVILLVQ
jgi:hypothetical protein